MSTELQYDYPEMPAIPVANGIELEEGQKVYIVEHVSTLGSGIKNFEIRTCQVAFDYNLNYWQYCLTHEGTNNIYRRTVNWDDVYVSPKAAHEELQCRRDNEDIECTKREKTLHRRVVIGAIVFFTLYFGGLIALTMSMPRLR